MNHDSHSTVDPFLVFTGDAQAARALRANLKTFADQQNDTPMGRLAREILAGRIPIQDLSTSSEFQELTQKRLGEYRDYMRSLTPQEQRQLLSEATALADSDEPNDR